MKKRNFGSKLNKHGFCVFRVIERLMDEWCIALANVWEFNTLDQMCRWRGYEHWALGIVQCVVTAIFVLLLCSACGLRPASTFHRWPAAKQGLPDKKSIHHTH